MSLRMMISRRSVGKLRVREAVVGEGRERELGLTVSDGFYAGIEKGNRWLVAGYGY